MVCLGGVREDNKEKEKNKGGNEVQKLECRVKRRDGMKVRVVMMGECESVRVYCVCLCVCCWPRETTQIREGGKGGKEGRMGKTMGEGEDG